MGLVDRAKAILLTPNKEWPVIEPEQTTVAALYSGYIIPLAAIPAIANFVRTVLVNTTFRVSPMRGLTSALVFYVLGLAGVYISALVVDALAPTFGGQKNQMQALKLVAYASTAMWVCGIFSIIPALMVLGILGLYSIYLFWTGLPVMMKNPKEKNLGYCVVAAVCLIVIWFVIGAVTAALIPTTATMGIYR